MSFPDVKIHLIDGDPHPPEGYTNMALQLIDTYSKAMDGVRVSISNTLPAIMDDVKDDGSIDLVGVSIRDTAIAPDAYNLIQRIRQNGLQVLAGGIHPSKNPDECTRFSDSVCVGFLDQETLGDIVRDLRQGSLSKYYYPKPNQVPVVDGSMDRMVKVTSVLTGVGCNFSCSFCTVGFPGIDGRLDKSTRDFDQEVGKVETDRIVFVDSNFGDYMRKDRKEKIDTLKRSGKKWVADISINYLRDPKFIEEIAEAGCREVYIGFESIDKNSLKSIHKGQNSVAHYEQIIRNLHQHGIVIRGAFVIGFDRDSPETVKRTTDFVVDNGVDFPTMKLLTPYPGTALYNSLRQSGRLLFEDSDRPNVFRRFDRRHSLFTHPNFTQVDMECAPDYFNKRIYGRDVIDAKLAAARGYLGMPDWEYYREMLEHYRAFDLASRHSSIGVGTSKENAEHFSRL